MEDAMDQKEITPDYSVAPQIRPEDVAEIKARGFRSIMCNRPDGEAPDQAPFAEIEAAAKAEGLAVACVPVVSGQITEEDVERFRAAMAELPEPVFAYCRSGGRCQTLFLLAQQG
jgi:sulfide:quinone oxidoreductase